jgi:hypothetical protein
MSSQATTKKCETCGADFEVIRGRDYWTKCGTCARLADLGSRGIEAHVVPCSRCGVMVAVPLSVKETAVLCLPCLRRQHR